MESIQLSRILFSVILWDFSQSVNFYWDKGECIVASNSSKYFSLPTTITCPLPSSTHPAVIFSLTSFHAILSQLWLYDYVMREGEMCKAVCRLCVCDIQLMLSYQVPWWLHIGECTWWERPDPFWTWWENCSEVDVYFPTAIVFECIPAGKTQDQFVHFSKASSSLSRRIAINSSNECREIKEDEDGHLSLSARCPGVQLNDPIPCLDKT